MIQGQYLRTHKRTRLPKYLTSTSFLVNHSASP